MGSEMCIRDRNATLWAGGFERINAYAYFAWIVVLAVVTLRRFSGYAQRPGRGSTGGG